MKRNKKKVNTNLILLLFGRMVSDTGSSIQMIIMPLYILDMGGSAATIGLYSFLSLMPTLVVYPFAGVLGDRLNRKTIMVVSDFVSAFVILILAYFSYTNRMSLALLLTVQVLVASLYGFFDPATKGILPQLVDEDELNKTNSKVASLRILSALLAPVIGASLYVTLGVTVLFLINGVSFLISGCSEMLIRYTHEKRKSPEGVKGILSDLTEGVRFIINNKVIRKLSVFFLVIYAFVQPVFGVILPLFFRTRLAYPDTRYGQLQMAIIFGALVGSVLVGLTSKKLKQSLVGGIISVMMTMLMFAVLLLPNILDKLGNDTVLYFVALSTVLFLLGIAIMFASIPVRTFIQKATPSDYMSRVFSIVGMISKGGMPLGALVYGMLLTTFEIHWTALSSSLLIILISTVFLISALRNLEI